jgi:hypothetical protein
MANPIRSDGLILPVKERSPAGSSCRTTTRLAAAALGEEDFRGLEDFFAPGVLIFAEN